MYGGLFLKLLIKVDPLHTIRNDIAIRTDHLNRYQAEVTRVLASMTELNESGKHDSDRFEALKRSLEFNQKQSNQFMEERSRLFDEQNRLIARFAREVVDELKTVMPLQMKVMAAIRVELNLGNDPDRAKQQMEAQLAQSTASLDALLAHLKVD